MKNRMGNFPTKMMIIIAMVLALGMIAGCNTLDFSILFKNIDGLKQKDPIILDNTVIGQVGKITYTQEATFLVAVEISEKYKEAVFMDTRFVIEDSPITPGEKAILIQIQPEVSQETRQLIAPGTILQGSAGETFFFPSQTLESLWKTVEDTFLEVIKNLEQIPETEQYQVFKDKLAELETQMKSSGSQVKEKIQDEILPQLEIKIKALMEKLEQKGEKDKAQSLEKELNRLQTI